jgi:hypothetical protein
MNVRRLMTVLFALTFTLAVAHADDKKPAAKSADGATKTLTGSVSDAMCGKSHMMPGKSAAECAKECAKDGDYALVVGSKVYTLKGHKDELEKFAGQNATVTGKVNGTTVEVASVAEAKMAPVKDNKMKPAPKKSM